MTTFACEFEMRMPVAKWLIGRALSPVLECQSLWNCDIVGTGFSGATLSEMVAVELKLSNATAVRQQCRNHVDFVTETWAAMPTERARRAAKIFTADGIGLLGVDESVEVIVPAARFEGRNLSRWQRAMRARRDEYRWRMLHPLMLRFPAEKLRREMEAAACSHN